MVWRSAKKMIVRQSGPRPGDAAITVMKMTKAVQSLTLNAVSGETRSFCRKISAADHRGAESGDQVDDGLVRPTSTPFERAASSLSRIAVRAKP